MLFLGQIERKRKNEALSELRKLKNERKVLNRKIIEAEEKYKLAKENHDRIFAQNIEVERPKLNGSLYGNYIERYK